MVERRRRSKASQKATQEEEELDERLQDEDPEDEDYQMQDNDDDDGDVVDLDDEGEPIPTRKGSSRRASKPPRPSSRRSGGGGASQGAAKRQRTAVASDENEEPGAGGGGGAAAVAAAAAVPACRPGGRVAGAGPTPEDFQRSANVLQRYKTISEQEKTKATAAGKVSRQQLDDLVRLVVRYMYFRYAEKPGSPVSRAELLKVISDRQKAATKKTGVAAAAIAVAQSKMLEIFGFEMREITRAPQRGKDRALAGPNDGTKHFLLLSNIPPDLHAEYVRDRSRDPAMGLTMVALSTIELAGGKISDDDFWRYLADIGISQNEENAVFGRMQLWFDDLVRRRYINVDRQAGPYGEVRTISIGEAAASEVGLASIKAFYEEQLHR